MTSRNTFAMGEHQLRTLCLLASFFVLVSFGASGVIDRIPEQVSGGTREDGQELAARDRAWLDDPNVSGPSRGAAGAARLVVFEVRGWRDRGCGSRTHHRQTECISDLLLH
jgi:hypothetical protein